MALDPVTASSGGNATQLSTPTIQLLPVDKVFPIQIGSESFKISGNALNSDSPSYFTQFFTTCGDNIKTLYIDRDPVIFKDIVRHLQGYLLTPRNEEHFVYLYSDAIYYRLPKLRQRLFRDFYVRIGDTSFQIPRELFNNVKQKGDGKNFFSMGFGSAMASPFPDDKMFPQLNMELFDADKQLRPPYMIPPKISRSSSNFNMILQCKPFPAFLTADMQGYDLDIQSDVERSNLIKDAKFYNLRRLSESLIPAKTYYNPFRGNTAEILINIDDFRPSNSRIRWFGHQSYGWLEYKRPHDIDIQHRDLIVQVDDDGMIVGSGHILLINRQAIKQVKVLKDTAEGRRTDPHSLPVSGFAGQVEIALRVEIPKECFCIIDGDQQPASVFEGFSNPMANSENREAGSKKRKLNEVEGRGSGENVMSMSAEGQQPERAPPTISSGPRAWMLKRSMWRVKIKGQALASNIAQTEASQAGDHAITVDKRTMVLVGIKLEGWSRESQYAKDIKWL